MDYLEFSKKYTTEDLEAENKYTFLVLSGTPMTGFKYKVLRSWVNKASEEDLKNALKTEIARITKLYDMWSLWEIIKDIKLHIHVPFNEFSKVIWICTCGN